MTELISNYPKYILRHFHINVPIYGAWKMFDWKRGTWGLGLIKNRIDKLAENDMTCIVSYNIKEGVSSPEYTIKAKKVQGFPVHRRNTDGLECYCVPVYAFNLREKKE